jgi:hypothetical protein
VLKEASQYDLNSFPHFAQKLQSHFPGAIPIEEYIRLTKKEIESYQFTYENTLGVISTCRDEIAEVLELKINKYWGKTFDFRSLSSLLIAGKTGIQTVLGHTPIEKGIGRFVFYAMPHIAISEQGEVGNVYREGIEPVSHACGSLSAVLAELESGRINFLTDPYDLEQSTVRQKILSNIRYGQELNLVDITKLVSKINGQDLERIQSIIDLQKYEFAVLTGVLIHGPKDTHWVYPQTSYIVNTNFPQGEKIVF